LEEDIQGGYFKDEMMEEKNPNLSREPKRRYINCRKLREKVFYAKISHKKLEKLRYKSQKRSLIQIKAISKIREEECKLQDGANLL